MTITEIEVNPQKLAEQLQELIDPLVNPRRAGAIEQADREIKELMRHVTGEPFVSVTGCLELGLCTVEAGDYRFSANSRGFYYLQVGNQIYENGFPPVSLGLHVAQRILQSAQFVVAAVKAFEAGDCETMQDAIDCNEFVDGFEMEFNEATEGTPAELRILADFADEVATITRK